MRKLDKYFRDNLKDAKTEYSSDLWTKIESSLDEGQKKTRPLWFYISSVLAILLIVGLGSLFFFNDGHIIKETDTATASKEVVQLSNHQNLKSENTQYNTLQSEDNDHDASLEESASTTINESNTANNLNDLDEVNQIGNSTRLNNFREQKAIGSKESISKINTDNLSIASTKDIATQNISAVPLEVTNSKQDQSFNALSPFSTIRTVSPFDFVYADELNAPTPYYTDVECGENEDLSKPGFGIDVYISPDLAFRDLNSMGDGETQYLIERERTENQSLSFSAGARISYTLKSGLTLRSGINYSQINETFNYTESRTQTTIIRDEDGNIISIEEELIEVDKKSSNSYKSVDVPILIGLEMPVNDRFSLSMNTGLFLTAAFTSRGKILSPELEPVFITEGSGDLQVYKSSLGVSYYGSIGFHHELSPGLELLVEPNLRYYSQSFTIADYPLTQDYIKFGILSGIKFRF